MLIFLLACQTGSVKLADTGVGPGDSATDTDTDTDTDTATDTDTDTDTDADTDTDTAPRPDREDCQDWGLFAASALVLETSSTVDGWDSRDGRYGAGAGEDRNAAKDTRIATNSAEECAIRVDGGTVRGDVWVGPGGYPDLVVCDARRGVLGAVRELGAAVDVTWPSAPSGMPESTGTTEIEWGDEVVLSEDRHLDALSVRTSSTLHVDRSMTLWVAGDAVFNNGSLTLDPGVELDLYVGGTLTVEWSSRLNPDGDPGALRVYALGGLSASTAAQIDGRVWVDGDARFDSAYLSGTLVARTVSASWTSGLRVDAGMVCAAEGSETTR